MASVQRQANGLVYSAAAVSHVLGIPAECSGPFPAAADDEIVVYYGGWDLPMLRSSTGGVQRMLQDQNWYDKYGWKAAEPGYYKLLLPASGSNRKNWNEQVAHLQAIDEAWQPAPVAVAATAVLVHLMETGSNLLGDTWCRCAEVVLTQRVILAMRGNRVDVHEGWSDDTRNVFLWCAASRLVASVARRSDGRTC